MFWEGLNLIEGAESNAVQSEDTLTHMYDIQIFVYHIKVTNLAVK